MKNKNKIFCTVFTPTYNREKLLYKLYDSLCKQTVFNFEWVIVDDGSTDNTEQVIESFIKKENNFKINYFKQKNGGKHRAINKGLDLATGKVFAIVDSDDYLVPNAIEKIIDYFNSLPKEKKYAGVAAQKGYTEDKIIGKTFCDKDFVDAKNTQRLEHNILGDKFEIYFTEILKKNKFPEIDGENFMTEAIVWNRIACQDYYIRWFNDILYICEYLDDGLTDTRDKVIGKCPIGYALYIKEQVKFCNISFKQKLGLYSYYALIRKKCDISYSVVAKELNTNVYVIYLSVILRVIIESIRGKHEKEKK